MDQCEPAAAVVAEGLPGSGGEAQTHKSRRFFSRAALKVSLYSQRDECGALLLANDGEKNAKSSI